MTNPAVPSSSTPQSALEVIGRADALGTGTANGVAIALTGAVVPEAGPFVALAGFGEAALGAVAAIPPITTQIAASSAAIQALQNQDAADSNNGINVFVDFSTYADATTLSGFSEAYNPPGDGTLGTASGYAVLQPTVSNFTGVALYSGTPTNTDYQIISAIYLNTPGGNNILIGRSNAGMTSYVYAVIFGDGSIALHNVVAGVDTEVVSQAPPFGFGFYAGAPYSLSCGVEGSARTYVVSVNGGTVMSWVDSSDVTNIGSLYRYCGFGLEQVAGAPPSQVAAFGFVDDAPAPLIGSVFRAYSTSSPVTVTSSDEYFLFPNSYFNTVGYASPDYTYAAATGNKLTVGVSGVYMVKVGVQWVAPGGNGTPLTVTFWPVLYHNGSVAEVAQGVELGTSEYATTVTLLPQGVFIIALTAGDYIQPGYACGFSSGTSTLETDGVGVQTMFSCALINTGTSG